MGWAEEELGSADLGDERVSRRLVRLAEDLSANPTASIPQACQGWAETKAAYRFFAREGLDWRAILQPHWERTEERMRACPRVLCPQDTTELDFTTQPGITGLGRLSYECQQGMYLHPTLALTPEGVMLGTLDVWMWKREPKGEACFKESVRWVEGYERVAEIAAEMPATRLVYIADREGDIRALMDRAAELGHPADWLIRCLHNRTLAEGGKLWAELEQAPVLGQVQFTLPRDGARKARPVIQTLRMARFELPSRGGKPLQVTAILAREEQPPEGEAPVEWRLLTNEALTTLEQCCERIDWYRRRWLAEIFFRILKSGCRVEALQLGTRERLERALALYLIVAWRIFALVTLGRECPELSCEVVFAPEEWQAAWIVARRERPPSTPPTLGQMTRIVAGFGGFLGRKGDGHPGPKALWAGMQKLMDYVDSIQSLREAFDLELTYG
jgi:Transposase DNA-binding/Transposase Tn5 dimerisation domain